jgi:hypothetical protein
MLADLGSPAAMRAVAVNAGHQRDANLFAKCSIEPLAGYNAGRVDRQQRSREPKAAMLAQHEGKTRRPTLGGDRGDNRRPNFPLYGLGTLVSGNYNWTMRLISPLLIRVADRTKFRPSTWTAV